MHSLSKRSNGINLENWIEPSKYNFWKDRPSTPFEAYMLYLGLKQHFTTQYDLFRYFGKITATPEAYRERKDKQVFIRLANSSDPQGLLIANFIENPKFYVRDLVNQEAKDIYAKWKERQTNLVQETQNQLSQLDGNVNDWLKVKDGQHPLLFKYYLKKLVDKETVLVLDYCLEFLSYWERQIVDPIVWKTKYDMLKKYQPFIMFPDESGLKPLILQLAKNDKN